MIPPVVARWDGEHFVPEGRFAKVADASFVIGEVYTLVEHLERSAVTHRHYFACVHDAWANLPESMAGRFPTSEHLRRWALIKAGFADERTIVCASKAEALRVAAFVAPMDPFAIVDAREATVRVWTAQSQNMRAMGRAEFQRSKDAVFAALDELLGTEPGTIGREAARAA